MLLYLIQQLLIINLADSSSLVHKEHCHIEHENEHESASNRLRFATTANNHRGNGRCTKKKGEKCAKS